MKKIILAFSVACVALGFASCEKKTTTSASSDADPAFVDSISEISGTLNGSMFAKNIETLPEAEKKNFKKEAFIRGLKEAYLTDTVDLGYILGLQIGLNILQQQRMMDQNGVPTNRNLFFNEFAAAFKADSLPEARVKELQEQFQSLQGRASVIMNTKQQQAQAAVMKQREEQNTANMAAGKAYVDKQKAADKSIQTTESGLSYKVVKQGTGAVATDNDRVKVKYTGRLIDGTVFDSNDEGIEFSPRGVVPGFGEGLKMMNKGSKYILYIPGNLAYGAQGGGEKIAPGATLVFDVEVLDITPVKK